MYAAKDMATLAPHLARHPKGIREEEWFWLEEHRKRVRRNERVPGREDPHKWRGCTNSRRVRVTPGAGKYRQVELKMLNAYIETDLANGFIQQSSPAAAPMRFAKKDDGLRLSGLPDISIKPR
jgi:hypothetical protein